MWRLCTTLFTEREEVLRAHGDMPDFVVKDSFQDARAALIVGFSHPIQHQRGDVEPPRFEQHGNNGEPRGDIVPGLVRRLPKTTVRRQGAVVAAQCAQVPIEQDEMHRLVRRDREEIAHEGLAHFRAEPASHVQRQVYGDEFDMGQRMEQRDPASQRLAATASRHVPGCEQLRPVWPSGALWHRLRKGESKPPQPPVARRRAGGANLGIGVARLQRRTDRRADRSTSGIQSAFAASSTSAAWPLTFTLFQTCAILPSAPTR